MQGDETLQLQNADGHRVGPARVRFTADGIAIIPVLDTLVMSASGSRRRYGAGHARTIGLTVIRAWALWDSRLRRLPPNSVKRGSVDPI